MSQMLLSKKTVKFHQEQPSLRIEFLVLFAQNAYTLKPNSSIINLHALVLMTFIRLNFEQNPTCYFGVHSVLFYCIGKNGRDV